MSEIDVDKLRRIAAAATPGPWTVQTSNSFRRIGTDRGDGDVVCAVRQRSDGHPDLHAKPDTLAYIAAVSPDVALALLDTIDHLRAEVSVLKKYRSERFDRAEQDQAWADAVATWKLQAGQRGNECVALSIECEKLRAALAEALVEWKAWLDDQRHTSMSTKDDEAIARLSKLLPVTP